MGSGLGRSSLAGHRSVSATQMQFFYPITHSCEELESWINVKNKDDHCLRWSLRSALFPVARSVDRPSQYGCDGKISPLVEYRGPNAAEH